MQKKMLLTILIFGLLTLAISFNMNGGLSLGLPKVLDYIGVNGSLIAVGALILVLLGYKLGELAVS
jgi:hypothetical protein